MFKRILVATDLTDNSSNAMDAGVALARLHGAALCLVHVVNDPENDPWAVEPYPMDSCALLAFIGRTRALAWQKLTTELAQLTPPPIDARVDVLVGRPAEEILKYATDTRIDLIVLGSRCRTHPGRATLGGVADHIVREASCPVLIVRAASAVAATSDAA